MRFDHSFARLATALCLFFAAQSAFAQTTVFINEIHYDNTGGDTGEAIEVAGPAGTDLAGWSVVLYNGSSSQLRVYGTISLSGVIPDLDSGYGVLSFEQTGIQNGAPDGLALVDASDVLVPFQFLSYEGSFTPIDGPAAGLPSTDIGVGEGSSTPLGNSMQLIGSGTMYEDFTWMESAANTFGCTNSGQTFGGSEDNQCPDPVVATPLFIHEVQGNGSASPVDGMLVVVEGIVVGDFQDGADGTHGDLNGFFVQEEDTDADADANTSEGIFIFDGSNPAVNVNVGDLVRVEGEVDEFFGKTQIRSFDGVTVVNSGNPLPTAAALDLPVTSVGNLESYEGMYVSFAQALVISDYFNFDRYGEIVLTTERYLTPTAEFEPGSTEASEAAAAFVLNNILLDDGRTVQNPDPAIHPNGAEFDLTNLFRGGDTVANVTGVLDYSFSLYRVQPTQGADYSSNNLRPIAPDDVEGNLQLASANVLNYFTTLDYWSSHPLNDTCGPAEDQGCRGADNADELARQRAKIIAALTTMDADIVGLVEIENNINDDALIDLVSGLNDAMGPGTYDYVATGTIGTDAIKVAFIYQPEAVSLVGSYAILDSVVDSRFLDTKNRPALAQTFIDNTTGGVFTAAVNHFKSKGSSCNDVGDPDTGDGSGNCNLTRTAAAAALVDWLDDDPTGSGDDDFIIIGDLNAYDKEDPIDAILLGGYTDLIADFKGEDAYSYVFSGQMGYLDHALASGNLSDQVTGTTEWHINADEPDLINYDTSYKRPAQDALYAPDPYRSSDHDPVIVGLETCDEIPPTIDGISLTPNVLWPANHKYMDVDATVIASDNFDPDLSVTLVSVTSNEPDNGVGDGNTVGDIVVVDDLTFKLRAERAGGGSGRIYTITYQATDDCGNSVTADATVTVPHNKGKKGKK